MDSPPSPSPEDQRRQDGLIITSVVMTVMAGIFVLLRCTSRFILIRTPGPDDYFMIGALFLTIGYVVQLFILKQNHLGFPMGMLTLDNMTTFIKVTLAIQVMYYANIFCIKTSILLTYLRFAVSQTFRMLCYGTIAIHAVFFVICMTVTLLQCRPLHDMWDLTKTVEGTCINTTAFFYSTSAFNIVTDVWILVLPFKTLRGIQRPSSEKIALFLIFGVGAFATVASIVRLHTIYIYTLATDPFRDGVAVNLWSMIEVTIAISCASVSALKPIFSGKQRRASRAAKTGTGSSGSGIRYPQQQGPYEPKRHVRMESLDGSTKDVLNSRSSIPDHRESFDHQGSSVGPGKWSVPLPLLQAPAAAKMSEGDRSW